jgi:isoquinoline 1-oxidoreductase beta subunit
MSDISLDRQPISRRHVLKRAAAGLAVLSIPVTLRGAARAGQAGQEVTAYVTLRADGRVVFQSPYAEMGQGITTMVAQALADELDVLIDHVTVEQAPVGEAYRLIGAAPHKMRITGGSMSTRSSLQALREAGATARAMLITAAAAEWKVPATDCHTEPGEVVHKTSGRKTPYTGLVAAAAKLTPPATVTLKPDDQLRYIGKPIKRIDTADKINGKAIFGIDIKLPNMAYATLRQCPVAGGQPAIVKADAALKQPGVIAVEKIPGGVAVVANSFWRAKQALEAVEITWDNGANAGFSSAAYFKTLARQLDEPGELAEKIGAGKAAFANAAKTISADYAAPFLAHATMEPMNATADIRADGADVWIGNQAPDFIEALVVKVTGLPPEKIRVHTPFLGGGFGRRAFVNDVALPAVLLSQKLGRPVKLLFTREEDFQHDQYRPATMARMRAAFDKSGKPLATHFSLAGDGPSRHLMPAMMANPKLDESAYGGLDKQPYALPDTEVNFIQTISPMPVGFWRSVENSHTAFYRECFTDEMAAAAGLDEIAFRRSLLAGAPRFSKVFKKALAMADYKVKPWKDKAGKTRAMGVALHSSFGSIVAEVAEVSIVDGTARVHKVWAVVDCGHVVNPAQIDAQLQSAIVYGLSAALAEEITFAEGKVEQSNFPDYPVLSPDQMPAVKTAFIESGAKIGGIGEVGTPPIAPAVVNALAKLTGKRIRSLPLSRAQLKEI